MLVSVNAANTGLSPLARGTHISEQKTKPQPRFIPAGAGNTYKTRTHPPRGAGNTIEIVFGIYSEAVYPRWRGEHNEYWSSILMRRGLSPLARGTLAPARRPES